MKTSRLATRMATATIALAVLGTPVALAASASAAPADGTVIAADPTPPPAPAPVASMVQQVVGIDANVVAGLSITGAKGAPVTLTARGEKARTLTSKGNAAVVFRQLTPGAVYTVAIDGVKVGTGIPVAAVGPAYGLTVSTTSASDELLLRWNQRPTKGQGTKVTYIVTAEPIATIGRTSDTQPAAISGTTTATVTTLAVDPTVKYTITVTPRNSASAGAPTAATMTRSLAEMDANSAIPTAPAAVPAPTPAPAPAADPAPATKTIYVCPAGTVPNGDLCRSTIAYTITVKDYTFHKVDTGPAPTLDSYETTIGACPAGYNYENYGWVAYCRLYGPAPTIDVKDATPAGFTDDGTHWVSHGTAPAGYTDSGTAWVKDVAKVATVVPA